MNCAFLNLPGEIRNQIYAMTIYPDLTSIVIANCIEPKHLAASVLHLPLFRVSRQIRAECFSYLCATFPLKIFGLSTATLFFSCAGPAVSEIKALVLVQTAVIFLENKKSRDKVEQFFAALKKMYQLKELGFEGTGDVTVLEQGGNFARRLEDLRRRGVDVQVKFGENEWCRKDV
jgi:hypothetical protein